VCNLAKCRYETRLVRCLECHRVNRRAILDCDGFESRYVRRVYHVSRRPGKRKTLYEMVLELYLRK
jgi:hypothetical protein